LLPRGRHHCSALRTWHGRRNVNNKGLPLEAVCPWLAGEEPKGGPIHKKMHMGNDIPVLGLVAELEGATADL